MKVIKQLHLWQDWLSCNTVLPVEKSKLFVLHLSKSELYKVTQLAGFKLAGTCAHLVSQLWHRVLCFFGAMPNTLLPNNLPIIRIQRDFCPFSPKWNCSGGDPAHDLRCAGSSDRKRAYWVWSENGSSTKIYHSDICRDCLVFSLWNQKTKWIWEPPVNVTKPSSAFILWPKEHFIIQWPFHPFSVCWPSAATNCEGVQAFFHSATSGPSIYAQVQEQLCTNRQLKTLCHL